MSQNEIDISHSLGGAPFNVGTCFFGRQRRRATTLKGASLCNYVLKLILNRDVRLFGRDVDVIVGGRHCFCHHRLKASIMISERIIQRIGEAPRPVPAGSQPRLRRCCFL
jgi:hypothetical protein